MAKKKPFKGDGSSRFFSLGDIPTRKLNKKQKADADDLMKAIREKATKEQKPKK